MKKLKVLLALNRFYPEVGGAETNLYFQATELAKSHDVRVLTPQRLNNASEERINNFNVSRFFDLLNPLRRAPNIRTKTLCPGMFFRVLFGSRADVILCFPAVSYNNMLVYLAAKIRRIPIVLCSFDLVDYAQIIERDGGIDPQMLKAYVPPKKEQFFFKGFDKIFAISNREMDVYRRYNPNVDYSPVPILLDEYEREVANPKAKYLLNDSDFVFLSLGRISLIKGQDQALKAFIRVADELPDSHLVLVGREDYDPQLFKEMQTQIQHAGLENRVHFTGMVERDEVLGWLKYSDIHVIPVRFMNSGAVVVESWAAGTPVIQSDAVDPNLVIEGENGYLFRSEDTNELCEKMTTAYQARTELPKFGAKGRRLVHQGYTYDSLTQVYEGAFNELVPQD